MKSNLIAAALAVLAICAAALVVHPPLAVAQQSGDVMPNDQMQMMHQQMVPGSQTDHAHDAGPRCLWRCPRDCSHSGS